MYNPFVAPVILNLGDFVTADTKPLGFLPAIARANKPDSKFFSVRNTGVKLGFLAKK